MNIEPNLQTEAPVVLTLTELRVLSGLSRGAAMPFEDSITIGSDYACDLILVDPGISPQHAGLKLDSEGRFVLRPVSQSGAASKVEADRVIERGVAFDLSGVRMVVCESDAEWDFALPIPTPPPPSAIDMAVANGVAAGRLGRGAAAQRPAPAPLDVKKLAQWGGGAVLACVVLLGLFLYFDADPAPPPAPPPVMKRVYSEADVQGIAAQFAARLDSLDIPGLKLVTAPQQLTVAGSVDRTAEGRFESAVQQLRDAHPGLKVRLDLGGPGASALPFEITAAIGGANGSVLLSDGQQLFVGAEEAGFKFLGLSGNCLNFLQVATQQKVSQCSDQSPRRP
jgi:hypothetical protein